MRTALVLSVVLATGLTTAVASTAASAHPPAAARAGVPDRAPDRAQAQVAATWTVATADSMDLSYPKPAMPCACVAGVRTLDLVRGEREDTQVVAQSTTAISGLKARVASVTGPDGAPADPAALSATVAPLGFLNVVTTAAYKGKYTYNGWMPDPIREDLAQVDVPASSRQPFWLELSSGATAPSGVYRVTVELSDATGATVQQQVDARVWPVAISEHNELMTTFTTHPDQMANKTYGMTDNTAIRAYVRKTYDFLAKYRIEPDNIYATKVVYNTRTATGPDPDDLHYLESKGRLNRFAAYNVRTDLPAGLDFNNQATWTNAINLRMNELTANMNVYTAEGLAPKAYVYGLDEINTPAGRAFAKRMFDTIKAKYPTLPIMTTLFDDSMGRLTALGSVDWWSPELFRYNREGADYAHANGDKVFWYPAVGTGYPYPNWYNGYPPINARMLTGLMPSAENVQGVLYYNIDRWYSPGPNNTVIPKPPMTDGVYSSWDPRTFRETAGDGSLYYPGPTGPLGSQRLANVRDGIEDFNLFQELRRRAGSDPLAQKLLLAAHLTSGSSVHTKVSGALRQYRTEVLQLIAKYDGTQPPGNPAVKLMPIGSSTIDGNTTEPTTGQKMNAGGRPDLWGLFAAAGTPVDFVGPSYDADQPIGDRDHAGIDGDLSVIRSNIDDWMTTYQPDVVLLHGGAREVLSETYNLANLPADLGGLVDRILELRPGVQVYLSTIGPITQDGQDDVDRTTTANNAILEVVRTRQEAGKPVKLLDNRARVTSADTNGDKIHLNASGYSKVASGWYAGIAGITPTRIEAESGTFGGLAKAVSTYYASGKAKAGYLDNTSSYVQLTYNAPYTGTYHLAIRGGNGSLQPSTHSLSVNGGPGRTITYEPYGWERWTMTGVDVDLHAGRNTLRFTGQSLYAEIDFVEVQLPAGERHANGPGFATRDGLDRLAYVARRTDGALAYGRQNLVWNQSTVAAAAPLAGTPAVAVDASGRTNYFARTTDGQLVHGWEQTVGAGNWTSETITPAAPIAGDPAVTLDRTGKLVYVARTAANQLVLGDTASSAIVADGTNTPVVAAGEPAIALDRDAAITIAARTATGALLLGRQAAPGSASFATWTLTSPSALQGRPALATDANGAMTYLARRTDGKLQHGWGTGVTAATWSALTIQPTTDTGGVVTVTVAGDPAVAQDVDGKLTYAVRTTDNRLLHGWQNAAAQETWHATILPTTAAAGDPRLVLDTTGRLDYLVRVGEHLEHGWQDTPGLGPWHTATTGSGLGS